MIRLLIIAVAVGIVSCSPVSQRVVQKTFQTTEYKFHDHAGFVIYDPVLKKTLHEYKGNQYFTPGSNTKIFTFFASLKLLGDSIPALRYTANGDSLIFWGTGDPSLLYVNTFSSPSVLEFLAREGQSRKLFYSPSNFKTEYFGKGWAWDDYNDYYSPERSPLPLYGNIVNISSGNKKLKVEPLFFEKNVFAGKPGKKTEVKRDEESNLFTWYPGQTPTSKVFQVPFKVSDELTRDLLMDTLGQVVQICDRPIREKSNYVFSIPSDSLYKVMMQESDNFVAEQLLLLCANVISDTLNPEIAIRHTLKNFLADLSDKPMWVDGSGLSRYNLFTPRSVVQLWEKIYNTVPRERLFSLLATGGKPGTLKNYFKRNPPYLFGKTGSLSNNHCLSGFLVTKSGRTLIFSFMNSNFTRPVSEVRIEMENILNDFYERY